MSLLISLVRHNLKYSFVRVIWISISLKSWHRFAACTKQQLPKIFFAEKTLQCYNLHCNQLQCVIVLRYAKMLHKNYGVTSDDVTEKSSSYSDAVK